MHASGRRAGTALNITKNAGAGDVQLSQVRLYDGHGSALKIRAAASPEWCHCPDAEAPAMATDDDGDGRLGLNTKWLCRADHAELSLTLAAPSAVTGCTLAWRLEPRARRLALDLLLLSLRASLRDRRAVDGQRRGGPRPEGVGLLLPAVPRPAAGELAPSPPT